MAPAEATFKALDFDASRDTVLNRDLGQYRIVHFATHSVLDNEHPELSSIVLSLVDRAGRPQNGFLRLYDIYNLRLGSDLVVVSACQTAPGEEIKGEGLVGLTRGIACCRSSAMEGPRLGSSLLLGSVHFSRRMAVSLMADAVRPKWTLTEEAFEGLLASIGPDRDAAAERYLEIRRNLVRLFEWR